MKTGTKYILSKLGLSHATSYGGEKLLSIIIPTYKPSKYIFECLDSIKNQEIPCNKFEVIIVLNGCFEPYYSALKGYMANSELDIKLVHTNVPGVSHARNLGLRLATGEFVHFVDDDDLLLPDLYKSLCYDSDMIDFGFTRELANGKTQVNLPKTNRHNFFEDLSVGKIRIAVVSILFRRSFLKKNNLFFDEKISYGEDVNFFLRAHSISKNVSFVKKSFYYYRFNENSAMNKKFTKARITSLEIQEKFLELIANKKYYKNFVCLMKLSLMLNYREYLKDGVCEKELKEVEDKFKYYFDKYFSLKPSLKANKRSVFVFFCWLLYRIDKRLFNFILRKM